MPKQMMIVRESCLVRLRTVVSLASLAAVFGCLVISGGVNHQRVLARENNAPLGGLIYYVNTTSDSVVVGACQNGNPGCSLRGAISAANANANADGIEFSIATSEQFCSTAGCTIHLISALPDITSPVSIFGPGADKLTVGRGSGSNFRIFNVTTAGTVDFLGITIRGGSAAGPIEALGGGIQNGTGTLNISGCAITENTSVGAGGAVFNSGTMNVVNTTISGNHSLGTQGGGSGGGIYNSGTLNVTNSTISGNTSRNSGGGITNNFGRTLNLTNSTVTGNTAGSLISGGEGGGVENVMGGTAIVKSTIIALNTSFSAARDVKGGFSSSGFNFIGDRAGSLGFTAPTDLTGDPRLDPGGLQYNGGPTRTIRLLNGSQAIDKGTSSGLTGSLTTDQRGAGYPRTLDNPAIANATGGNGTDIGAVEQRNKSQADFDGDGKTDISIFRPASGQWWIQTSSDSNVFAAQFGASTDRIMPGDFTGDGKTDIALWRPSSGLWLVLRSEDFSYYSFPFGTNGDIPTVGDFDGDHKDDAALFRPSDTNWYIARSSGGTTIRQFGSSGDNPVPSDYDGDGKFDIAIYRPSSGQWWVNRSSNASTVAFQFGASVDKPVPGDFTGDGLSDIAFWRPSTGFWFVLRSEDSSFFSFPFGANGDTPAPGDYDGDAKHDAAVFRPSSSTWFINRSSAGSHIQQFGSSTDRPVPSAFVP